MNLNRWVIAAICAAVMIGWPDQATHTPAPHNVPGRTP